MATTNNTTENNNYKSLSIQISLNGLSFCILNTKSNSITNLNTINFDKRVTPFKLLDILKDQFLVEPSLGQNFESVQLIHVNELATIVPYELFNANKIADYLKFNSKILKSDFIAFDTIEINKSVCVYVPYVNINNFIYDKFGSFTYKHESTILINQLLNHESNSQHEVVYLNIHDSYFQVIAINKGKLMLYNSFEFQTNEDFIYYVLFTLEQLNLNTEDVKVILLGNITEESALYAILFKYIRYVDFGSRFDSYNYSIKPINSYSDFSLIHSF